MRTIPSSLNLHRVPLQARSDLSQASSPQAASTTISTDSLCHLFPHVACSSGKGDASVSINTDLHYYRGCESPLFSLKGGPPLSPLSFPL